MSNGASTFDLIKKLKRKKQFDDDDGEEGGIENKNSLVNFSFFHSLFLYYFSPLFRVFHFFRVSPILSQLITRARVECVFTLFFSLIMGVLDVDVVLVCQVI